MSLLLRNWANENLQVRVYVSTSGDFVTLGDRTYHPFESGGPNGCPLGWTPNDEAGSSPADVNRSVGLGRFNISSAGTNRDLWYGAYKDFPQPADYRTIVQLQARTMDTRSSSLRLILITSLPSQQSWGSQMMSESDWENISLVNSKTTDTSFRLSLQTGTDASDTNWGVQFQSLSFLKQPSTFPQPTWNEITCDVRNLAIRYGREKYTNRYDSATMQVGVNNDDGEFTFKTAHEWGLRPGRFIRATVTRPGDATEYPYYYGILDSLTDGYTLDGHAATVLNCVDVSSLLSNTTVPTTASTSTTWKSGARFRNLYNAVGWHPSQAVSDAGLFTQQTVKANGRSVRDELGLIADSEGGWFMTDRNGRLQFYDRDAPSRNTRWREVQAEILAMPYHGGGAANLPQVDSVTTSSLAPVICAHELVTDWNRDRIVNDLQIANQGYASFQYMNDESMKKYGPRTYSRMDLLNINDKSYLDLRANDIMTGYTESVLRVNSVSFRIKPDAYRYTVAAFLNDLVRIRYQHPVEGWGFSVVTRIQSLANTFTTKDWVTIYVLDQPVDGSFNFWLTPPQPMGWDVSEWDIGLWDEQAGQGAFWSSGQKWSDPLSKWGY